MWLCQCINSLFRGMFLNGIDMAGHTGAPGRLLAPLWHFPLQGTVGPGGSWQPTSPGSLIHRPNGPFHILNMNFSPNRSWLEAFGRFPNNGQHANETFSGTLQSVFWGKMIMWHRIHFIIGVRAHFGGVLFVEVFDIGLLCGSDHIFSPLIHRMSQVICGHKSVLPFFTSFVLLQSLNQCSSVRQEYFGQRHRLKP